MDFNYRGIMLVLNTQKKPHPKQTPSLCPCYSEYLFLISIASHAGRRLHFQVVCPPSSHLPPLLLLLCIQPWLRSFIHLLKQRTTFSLFLPAEIWQSLTHEWREASHPAFAIAERLVWESSYPWCGVWSVNPVMVREDPVSDRAKETGWCFNLSNVDVSLQVSPRALCTPLTASMGSPLMRGSNTQAIGRHLHLS